MSSNFSTTECFATPGNKSVHFYSLFDRQDCSPRVEASTLQSALEFPRDLISFPLLLILTCFSYGDFLLATPSA
jgi:hypothetical protein